MRHEASRSYNRLRAVSWSPAKIRATYTRLARRARTTERAELYRGIAERAESEI